MAGLMNKVEEEKDPPSSIHTNRKRKEIEEYHITLET